MRATELQESDKNLQRRHGAPLCGAFSFAASGLGEDAGDFRGLRCRGEHFRYFVFSGQDPCFSAFLPVFGEFRGETQGGGRGAVEKIGENGKIRSFRAFFTTLRFC